MVLYNGSYNHVTSILLSNYDTGSDGFQADFELELILFNKIYASMHRNCRHNGPFLKISTIISEDEREKAKVMSQITFSSVPEMSVVRQTLHPGPPQSRQQSAAATRHVCLSDACLTLWSMM
ncbi:hypothetical protein BaRGS_00014794 [Batillaria attramentaria]|uniref:Uncharacterized protein n=1 Tax=Batillaria attramentaria TaxID=370345 RepID=A0ABD0L3J6_9CAEN